MLNQRNVLFAGTLALALGTAPLALAQNDQNSQSGQMQQHNQAQNQQQEKMTPENFVDGASAIHSGELDAAEMALDKDDISSETRQLAERIQKDHTQANQKLEKLAESKDLELSATANLTSLAGAPELMVEDGNSFDSDFAALQVDAHKEALEFFQRAANTLQDQELKQYASDALPNLQEHLEMAQALQKQVANQ